MFTTVILSLLIIPEIPKPIALEPSPTHVQIHCPEPSSITITPVPSSFHSVMSATSTEGVAFGTFGFAFANPKELDVYGAEISEVNGYYRFACGYKKGAAGFTLSTRDNPAYAQCYFWNGEQVCEGGIEDCALICPADAFPELKN